MVMIRRLLAVVALTCAGALPLAAQSADAACGATNDVTTRQFIKVYGDLRLCLLAYTGDTVATEGPRAWTRAPRAVYETQRENEYRRMAIVGDSVEWTINGQPRPADSAAMAWRLQVIDVLQPAWEAAQLRGEVAGLRLRIDSLPALRARTVARMDSLEKRVAAARARVLDLRARDRSAQSNVTTQESRLHAMEAQLDRERTRLNTVDPAARARAEKAVQQMERQVQSQERAVYDAQRKRDALDVDRQIGAIELDLRESRPEHQQAMLKLELGELDAESIPLLEQQLANLDADNRLRVLDAAADTALARLRTSLSIRP
jgi:hypothetical protein